MAHRRSGPRPDAKRPKTLAEIKESLSTLLDEPLVPDSQLYDSDDDNDDEAQEDHLMTGLRREDSAPAILRSARPSVVNRLNSKSGTLDGSASNGPLAFHASAFDSVAGFKVPSLLRRATTNLSTASNSSSSTTTAASETGVRVGGSKKANIHYQAREAERRKIVEAAERKRKEGLKRNVVGRGRASVLGALSRHGSGFD